MLSRTRKIQLAIGTLALAFMVTASGCAKNVDRIDFTKWGNSFIPTQRPNSGMDTTAQGGAAVNGVVPQGQNHKVPKASMGGTYHRTFATSPNYRMVGGFHVTGSQ